MRAVHFRHAGILAGVLFASCVSAAEHRLSSPDGKLAWIISDADGLTYGVQLAATPVITSSPLGLTFAGDVAFGPHARITGVQTRSHDSTWENPLGVRRIVRDRYNELDLTLQENGREFTVLARAYDNGIAFRYAIDAKSGFKDFVVTGERTAFTFAGNDWSWSSEATPAAEAPYLRRRLNETPDRSVPPLLAKTAAAYVLITEADLRDWAGLLLSGRTKDRNARQFVVAAAPAPRLDGRGLVVASTPRLSPWRVIMVAADPAELVGSDLVATLAAPNVLGDTSWVRPGLSAWDCWWTGENPWYPGSPRGSGARGNTASHEAYIDFAAEMGWPYQLVDWYWSTQDTFPAAEPHVDLPAVFAHAKQKGVRLFMWVHSKSVERYGIEKTMAAVAGWGAAGVKIDFMNRNDQEMVKWYEDVIAAAARHHLMIDFHGAYVPTGLARTYPNYITQEGVLGNEFNKFGYRCSPEHEVTLPFTRGVLGPMDFTPGGFLNRLPGDFDPDAVPTQEMGTRARQLAQVVVYFSPLTVMCDSPAHYRGQPGIDFFRDLPTVWDDTVVLKAEPGRVIAVARRHGDRWWLAALNDGSPAEFEVPMAFLGGGEWQVRSWSDTDESVWKPAVIAERVEPLHSGARLKLRLAPAGGYAAVLAPVRRPANSTASAGSP